MASDRNQDRERVSHGERIEVRSGDLRDTDASASVRRTTSEPLTSGPPAAEMVRHETGRPQRSADRTAEVEIPESYNLNQDRVRWGPIIAGLLTALTTLLLLGLLGLAIGLTTVNAGSAAAQGGPPPAAGTAAAIWGAVTALVAFFLGGWVAGRTAAVFDRRWGAWNGALVFMVAVPVTTWLAGQGLGFLAGTLGNFAGALNIDASALANQAQQAANQVQQAVRTTQPSDVGQAAAGARYAAWGTLLGLLVGLFAAALGGALGTRREISLERATADVTRG